MFIKTLKVEKEARFNVDAKGWRTLKATTRDIYEPVQVSGILLNADFITSITPTTYKSGMCKATPKTNANSKYLLDVDGARVLLSNGAVYTVTATIDELDAVIGTQYVVDVA